MSYSSAKRLLPVLRGIVCFFAVIVSLMHASTAQGSCGDYLQTHRDMRLDSVNPISSWHSLRDIADHPLLPVPNDGGGCKNGRCHSVPFAPPTDPTQVSVSKRLDFVTIDQSTLPRHGLLKWNPSLDSRFPALPFLEVDSPPPKSS